MSAGVPLVSVQPDMAHTQCGCVTDTLGRKLFFRSTGSGAPMVLLHASPLSSASLLPLMQALSGDFCVLAFDTPGYGNSCPTAAQSLQDYADALAAGLSTLGVWRFALYGVATGAQIALEFAKRFPARVAALYLDGACHFEDAERARVLSHTPSATQQDYFPDLSPEPSGAHLTRIWHIVNALFEAFPWFSPCVEDRLQIAKPPLGALHTMALDYWRAGPDYARAYRLAFANERAAQFAELTVPTAIFRRGDSLLLRYTDALLRQSLPGNVCALQIAPGPARFAAMRAAILEHGQQLPVLGGGLPTATVQAATQASYFFARPGVVQQSAPAQAALPAELAPAADGSHLLRGWQRARAALIQRGADLALDELNTLALGYFLGTDN
jgi:pimeloyl-ACP methyl ester carboxylesterase